jgi:hypothetical protein
MSHHHQLRLFSFWRIYVVYYDGVIRMMSFHLDSDHGGVDFSRFHLLKSRTNLAVSQV